MRRGEREYAYKKEKERERASRVADLCVGWAPDTGVWPAGSLPIGASWIQSLKTIIWTECMRACVCMCVCVGGENIYLSGCTWATVTNYFPLTLSFIMKYTNCLHVFSQAKHTHTHTHAFAVTACNVPSQAWLPPPAGTSKVIPSLLLWANSLALLFSRTQTLRTLKV